MAINKYASALMTRKVYFLAIHQMAKIYPNCNEGMKTNLLNSDIEVSVEIDTYRFATCFYANVARNHINITIPHEEAFGSFPDYTEETCRRYSEVLFDNFRECGSRREVAEAIMSNFYEFQNYVSRRLSIY